jgi:hypothetical protein
MPGSDKGTRSLPCLLLPGVGPFVNPLIPRANNVYVV